MFRSLLLALSSLLLFACSATTANVAATSPSKADVRSPAPAETHAEPVTPAAPEAEPAEETAHYVVSVPAGWRHVTAEDGSDALLHQAEGSDQIDAMMNIEFIKADGMTPENAVEIIRKSYIDQKAECADGVVEPDGSSAMFDVIQTDVSNPSSLGGRVVFRRDPVLENHLIKCLGIWQASIPAAAGLSLGEQVSSICAGISADEAPEKPSAAGPMFDYGNSLVDSVPTGAKPHVVVPEGWLFNDRTGQAAKFGPDGKPLATAMIRSVPKMDLTVEEHAKALTSSVENRKERRVTLRGKTAVSADGQRAAVGMTLRESADGPIKAEGVAIIRVAAGLDDAYELCMANWDPAHPELQAEAESFCDSFSIEIPPSSAIIHL